MGQNLIAANGGGPQKQTRFVSLFTSRFLTGYFPNRNLLRSPMQYIYSDFYHLGSTDALCDGLNTELSNNQTLIRRPGNPKYCTVATDAAVDNFYSFHESTGSISVAVDTVDQVDIMTPSALTTVFTKSAGAGLAYFQGVNTSLYITDGVDLVKYIPDQPGNINPKQNSNNKYIWNFGGVAPTIAPTLQVTETGSSGIQWVASTIWSTMGFIDAGGYIQQMVSVNASGSNTTQLGTTGNGAPDFSGGPGTTVTESSGTPIVWQNQGLISTWQPGANYYNASTTPSGATIGLSCIIYDPGTQACYIQINGSAGQVRTSGITRPHFQSVVGWSQYGDGNCKWFFLGTLKVPGLWQPSHSYPTLGTVDDSTSGIVTPVTVAQAGIGGSDATPVYWWVATTGGTSGTSGSYAPTWSTTPGFQTTDGDIIWTCICNDTWLANTDYTPWYSGATSFGAINDGANIQVCISANGPSGPTAPSWSTGYSNTTQDGTGSGLTFVGITWACVGSSLSWAANTQWYLPVGGFVPPQTSQPYGGATLSEAGINQYVTNSGESGSSAPTWGGINTPTTDGGVTWYAASTFTSAGFPWTTGHGWCYAYKARTSNDVSVLTAPPLQIPGTNSPNITGPLGQPIGCGDGTVTTASPVTQLTGPNLGAQVLITMVGSTDPQFDTISVYRSADGFGAGGPYLWLTDIPMPPMNGANPGIAQIIDFMPDLPTNLLPGLDPLITAPIDDVNDPPPGQYGSTQFQQASNITPMVPLAGTTLIGQVYHQGRMWGFLGNSVFASGGPDTNPGNGMTAWPPDNEFPFDNPIVLLVPTATALLVFTTNDILLLGGGPAISDYYSQLLVPDVGINSPNAVCLVLGLPYLFSSDREFITVDPSGGFTRVGHPIGNNLVSFDPSQVYVTHHSFGDADHAIYISNGTDTWYRCDPYPAPDSQITGPTWSPPCVVAAGFKAMQSTVVAAGQRQLLLGPAAAGYVLNRDSTFTTFADNGSPYEAFYTMGNIVLAHPGQMALCAFLEMDFVKTGTQPTVSVLFDELGPYNGAAFEVISNTFVTDPPKLYGPSVVPDTLWMNRYYFGQTTPQNGGQQVPLPAWCKFLQVKVDYGDADTVMNETLAFTIFGALYQEK